MGHGKYGELYEYLEAFKEQDLDEITNYLGSMGQSKLDVFSGDLARLDTPDSFEKESIFNYTVDSTLQGGRFPCSDLHCRAENVRNLARFAALYADKVLIHSPLEQAFEQQESIVDVRELAFAIYLLMRLKPLVENGIVGFTSSYIHLCNDCLQKRISERTQATELIKNMSEQIIEEFINSVVCTLETESNGTPVVSIKGMDEYGSHEVVDVSFKSVPNVYENLLKDNKPVILKPSEVVAGGLPALLTPMLEDSIYALTTPHVMGGSYLTTRPAQIALMKSVSPSIDSESVNQKANYQGLSCMLPFATNATIDSILQFRKSNYEAFQVYRDEMNLYFGKDAVFNQESLAAIKRDVVDPEIHKMNNALKISSRRLAATTGANVLIGGTAVVLGQLVGMQVTDIATLVAAFGVSSTAKEMIGRLQNEAIQKHPLYFLWRIQR